jgi:A/G-specific adenine glycosylase
LPWRKSPANPYEIWISEVMSQQSTLKMMLPYFDKWMQRFPTLQDLANAPEDDLLKHWEGLGYYSRARNIHRAAKLMLNSIPQTPEELQKLPGVGPYTSAAIASIAFDHPAVAVDGNVTRVLSRYFGIPNPFGKKEDAKKIFEYAQNIAAHVPVGKRGVVTQALMELGALVCRPQNQAKCFECPLRSTCSAYKTQKVAELPYPKSRPQMQKVQRVLLLYKNKRGQFLLRQRPQSGVLGGQWELPYIDLDATDEELRALFNPHFEVGAPFKHSIMNKSYTVWPLEVGLGGPAPEGHCYLKAPFKGVLSTVTRKFLKRSKEPKV